MTTRWSIANKFRQDQAEQLAALHERGEVGELWRCNRLGALHRVDGIDEAMGWLGLGVNIYADVVTAEVAR